MIIDKEVEQKTPLDFFKSLPIIHIINKKKVVNNKSLTFNVIMQWHSTTALNFTTLLQPAWTCRVSHALQQTALTCSAVHCCAL